MASGARPEASAPLADRVALVTGASSGIGRAIALALAGAGADVALTYQSNQSGAHEVKRRIKDLGRRAAVMHMDLTDDDSVRALGGAVLAALGRIDVWVNNAGADVLTGEPAALTDEAKLDRLLAVDLRGTILASWCAAEILRSQDDGGVILNMSWDHASAGMPGRNPQMFAAAKGGVLAFSKALAKTLGPEIRVNVLAPGWIETSFAKGLGEERRRAIADSTPLKRWGTPEDVANAAVFLASPAAAFVTGQTLFVGGGAVT